MRERPLPRLLAGLAACALLLPILAGPALAQAKDPCKDPKGSLSDYVQQLGDTAPEATKTKQGKSTTDDLARRATSDGLAGGRLDLLRRAFVALDLGTIKEEQGDLVFNFNPDALHLGTMGQFSPRVVVHQPALYGAVDKKIDSLAEAVRQGVRDALKKDLGDLDDIEVKVRWTPNSQEPESDLQAVASQLYDSVPKVPIGERISEQKAKIAQILGITDPGFFGENIPVADICGNEASKSVLLEISSSIIAEATAKLEKDLEAVGFFDLADLIDGEPRLVFDISGRQRSDIAGPDEINLNATWQLGWVSYRGAKRYAAKQKGVTFGPESVRFYLKEKGRLKDSLPLFSFSASYSSVRPFDVTFPGVTEKFSQKGSHKASGLATAGTYFGGGRDRRLELAASYDDVSNDPALHDRWLFKLSWVEQLSPTLAQAVGGSEFVATLIYANKPEFRGDVQHDLGMRAGLKWSLGKKEDQKAR